MNERQEIEDAASVIREALEAATMLRAGSPKTLIDDACIALASLRSQLETANSLNRKHDTETTSIHADMLALARLVGAHYDGASSPAGFLHGDIMPKVNELTAQLQQAERERDEARAALDDIARMPTGDQLMIPLVLAMVNRARQALFPDSQDRCPACGNERDNPTAHDNYLCTDPWHAPDSQEKRTE